MVLGSTRERPNAVDELIDEAPSPFTWADWQVERGPLRWEGGADLAGGFPGFAARGGRLDGVQLRLTDRYLLADEGRQHGFGLPLEWLLGADLVPSSRAERPDPTLRVRYADGAHERTFQARFRGSFLSPRGRRAEQALAALSALGLLQAGEALPPEPDLGLSWDEAARFEGENVIWSGRASAALGAAGERAACDVWLTTRSIIWGSSAGEGIFRLPLGEILDVVPADLADRARTPAVIVATADALGGRHEYPFVFDRHSPAQRNLRERGAFLVGLRSRGLALGAPAPLPQPWRSAIVPAMPGPLDEPAASRFHDRRPAPTGRFQPRPLTGHAAEPTVPGRWERAMAEWTGRPAWLESPPVDEPPAPDETTVRERLASLFGPAAEAPGAEVTETGGPTDDASPTEAAGLCGERGVIVPWPGPERAARRRPSRLSSIGVVPLGVESIGSSEAPNDQGAPAAPPAVEASVPEGEAERSADGGYEFAAAADPFVGAWPIPAGFLGEVVASHFASRGSEEAFAHSAPSSDAAAGDPADAPTDESVLDVEPAADTQVLDANAADESAVPASADQRAALRAYEASLLRSITGTLRAIEDRLAGGMAGYEAVALPNPAERSVALAALDLLVSAGELPATEADVHRSLLLAAGEAGPRLRSLLELRDAGYLADGELDRKRREIVAPLATLLTR